MGEKKRVSGKSRRRRPMSDICIVTFVLERDWDCCPYHRVLFLWQTTLYWRTEGLADCVAHRRKRRKATDSNIGTKKRAPVRTWEDIRKRWGKGTP
jgi:hypothetical protein